MTEPNTNILRKLVETVGIALLAVNSKGQIVFSNPAATKLFGYTFVELDALRISDLLPAWGSEDHDGPTLPPDADVVLRPVDGRHKFGNPVPLVTRITPASGQDDDLRYTLALRDITTELEAERLSQAESQRMAYAVKGARIGVFEVDMSNNTSIVSGVWRELMDVGSDEDIDAQIEWRRRVHPDDLPRVEQADRDCIEGRSERSLIDYRMRSRDGSSWRWMRSDAVAGSRDDKGVATRLIGAQTDITDTRNAEEALRQSERQFRSAMEYAPIGKALLAPDGRWLKVNPAICRFLGYTEQELLAIDFQTITHPDDLAKDVDHVKRLLTGDEHTYSMEKRYLRPDGNIIWGHLSVALVRDEKGVPLHFISQIVDITERHRLERMKRDFTATVSHELRTPVTSIAAALGLIDPATFDALPDKARKLITISRQNCGHLRLLLDDILDFEKLSSDKMSINVTSANVVEIIEQSIQVTQPYADQHDVEVTLDAHDQAIWCKVDPTRFQQVIINLLSNAAKFSHEGGSIRVSVAEERAQVRISVVDQGIGIPEEMHHLIFEPFSQVDPSDTRERRGTGLGLSLSKQLTERMGGMIGFCSPKTGGTEFWITLPAER